MKPYHYTTNIKRGYAIEINGLTPYEVYMDDIPLEKYHNKGGVNTSYECNPYLLGNGKHTVKLKLFPLLTTPLIKPTDVYDGDIQWKIKLYQFEYDKTAMLGTINNKMLIQFPILKIEQPVPVLEQEWEFEIKDLPYELEGWRNGQDLRKIPKEELEKEVVAYYKEMRELLNDGKVGEFLKATAKGDQEISIALYETPEEDYKSNLENFQELSAECPGTMLPIENYQMFIYGNGKLVKLERTDGKFKGVSTLIRNANRKRTTLKLMLYKPMGSDKLEPIR